MARALVAPSFQIADAAAFATPQYRALWEELVRRVDGPNSRQTVFETTIAASALASAASVTLLAAGPKQQWKVRFLMLQKVTDFSGGSGDRLLSIKTGSTVFSIVPAASLQTLPNAARWGDTALPYPTTATWMTTESAVGANIVAQYSGGSNDYATGSLKIILTAERTV